MMEAQSLEKTKNDIPSSNINQIEPTNLNIAKVENIINFDQSQIQSFDMLNPIMPPSAKIDRGTNNWAVGRLESFMPRVRLEKSYINSLGQRYIKGKKHDDPHSVSVGYIMCGACLCSFGLCYEGCGVCCLFRKAYLRELVAVIENEYQSVNQFSFSTSSLKVLRLFYLAQKGNSLIKFQKMKKLVELSICAQESSTEFANSLTDQLKGCNNLKKLILDLPKLNDPLISKVVGFLPSLESLNINLNSELSFNNMEQSLPNLKELSLYNQSLNSLENKSSLIKKLLVLKIKTDTNPDSIPNILKNIIKNGVPLRQLSLIVTAPYLYSIMEQIGQISSLQILEIRNSQGISSQCILDVEKLKNLQTLDLKNLRINLKGQQNCANLKRLSTSSYVNVSDFSTCTDSLRNLQEVEVDTDQISLNYFSQGLQHALNLQALKIKFTSTVAQDENLEEFLKALPKIQQLKVFSLQAKSLEMSDNALIKISNAVFHKQSKLQMFELRNDKLPLITGQSFELLIQSAATHGKSLVIFNLDIKYNDNLADQSLKEVSSSFSKIRGRVKRMDVQIQNLGRINEEMMSKLKRFKSKKLSNFNNIYPMIKDIFLYQQGTDEAITVFDTDFKY